MSRTLLRDSTIYGIGTLLTQSLGFLLIPIYTRFLSVSDYGALSLLNATLQVVSFITVLGVSSAAMRFWFEPGAGESQQRAVYANATVLLLLFPALILLLLGPLIWFLYTRLVDSIAFYPLVLMVITIGLFSPFIKLITGFLRVQRRATAFVAFNLAFFLVQTGTVIAAVAWLNLGLRGQVAAQLLTNGLFAIVALIAISRFARPSFSGELSQRMLAFGVPLVPFFIATWINTSAGRFMLEATGGLAQVGILALAAQLAGVMQLAAVAFDNAMLPHFLSQADKPGGARELGIVVNRYLGFLGMMALGIVALASPAIALVASAPYQEAARWVAPMTVAAWLAVANQPVVWSLNHAKRTGLLSGVVGGSTVVLVLLLWLLLGPLDAGIAGVPIAMISANLVLLASGWLLARRHLALQFQRGRLAGIVVTLLVCGAALDRLAQPQPEFATLAAQFGLLAVAALVIAALTGLRLPRATR